MTTPSAPRSSSQTQPESQPLSPDAIRKAYLDFFEARQHLIVPSSSLIPSGDPTLLLTSAGMVQFKDYYTGAAVPPNPRLASCQKCFRTSDIESVGDTKHLTLFEMLGNFSIGNYFKKEAIAWAWEFVTGVLGLPPDRLWVTYYKPALSEALGEGDQEDLEAKAFWLEATQGKLPESRIVPLGKQYNWWGPAGEEGPCGPCSEIHYAFEPGVGIEDLTGDSTKAVEVWNLVFTQFYHHRDGKRTPLPAPNIDTGMGLERAVVVANHLRKPQVKSVYQTPVFDYLLEAAALLAGKRYGENAETDYALRVLAEHSRAVTFLVADGVVPSNEGRGYVLRRILRRAIRYARQAGIQETMFLTKLANFVMDRMGDTYPELQRERDFVLSVVEGEEQRFSQTLRNGLDVVEGIVAWMNEIPKPLFASSEQAVKAIIAIQDDGLVEKADTQVRLLEMQLQQTSNLTRNPGRDAAYLEARTVSLEALQKVREHTHAAASSTSKPWTVNPEALTEQWQAFANSARVISGRKIFELYDTFGFPADIARDIAAEHGLEADLAGFEQEMQQQRERSRAAAKFGLGDKSSPETYRQLQLGQTRFTGYEQVRGQSVVIGLLAAGQPAERATKGTPVEIILRETPFYAESGGQVGDTGELRGPSGVVRIKDTQAPIPGLTAHVGEVVEGEIAVGEPVEALVDTARRADIVRNHTGTHMLHAALRKVLGNHVRQGGSLVTPERLRFDFSHPSALSSGELAGIQSMVNDKIMENLAIAHLTLPYKEAIQQGALAFFGDKYGDIVRTCRIGANGEIFSFELCGGTHAHATGEIGLLSIESEGSVGAGTRRIEAVTGHGVGGLLAQRRALMEALAKELQTSPTELVSKASALLEELDRQRKRSSTLERELAKRQADSIAAQAQSIDGVTLLTAQVNVSSAESLREMGDWLRDRLGSAVVVLGAVINEKPAFVALVTKDLTAKGYNAGNIIREVAKVAGGGGGGRPDLAQAGGRDSSKLTAALDLVPTLIKKA